MYFQIKDRIFIVNHLLFFANDSIHSTIDRIRPINIANSQLGSYTFSQDRLRSLCYIQDLSSYFRQTGRQNMKKKFDTSNADKLPRLDRLKYDLFVVNYRSRVN